MTASYMIELINRTPFRPLEIHLNNGAKIEVIEPYQVATAPNAAAFTVHLMDRDESRLVAYRSVAEIVTKAASSN